MKHFHLAYKGIGNPYRVMSELLN